MSSWLVGTKRILRWPQPSTITHDETDDGGDDQDDDKDDNNNDVTCDNDDNDETGDVWIFFYIHHVTIQL